jgi:hypothetical protein
MICFDEASFGVYPFPINAVEVEVAAGTPMQIARPAQLEAGILKAEQPASTLRPGARMNRALQSPIHSWLKVAPDTASMALTQATPGFWLNRFRRTSDVECLVKDARVQLDLKKVLAARASVRRRLVEHSISLTSKFWSMRYHRENFRGAVKEAGTATGAVRLGCITRATAEFAAHDACIYSILEELTRLFAAFESVRSGKDLTKSFHKLYDMRETLPDPLRAACCEAAWYGDFQRRRANSTHAFASIVVPGPNIDDISLYQRADRIIYGSAPQPDLTPVGDAFAKLTSGFDRLVDAMSSHLLGLFHPWDIVTLMMAEKAEDGFSPTTVWVRTLEFDPALYRKTDAWVMTDQTGEIAMVAHREEAGQSR